MRFGIPPPFDFHQTTRLAKNYHQPPGCPNAFLLHRSLGQQPIGIQAKDMKLLAILAGLIGAAVIAFLGFRLWQFTQLYPATSKEVIQLTPDKRAALLRLQAEAKFLPHDYRPMGYTGAATPVDRERASSAVDAVIAAILQHNDGPRQAEEVSGLFRTAMKSVTMMDTEDRDRTIGYLLEIWYYLGFKGATGRFAHGAAYLIPEGYGEPLPPGWSTPNTPRPIP